MGRIKKEWLNFKEAKKFVKDLNLKSVEEWVKYCKSGNKPENIPNCPETVYSKDGWNGYVDWLSVYELFTYEEASLYIQNLNINSRDTWREFSKTIRPKEIPSQPEIIYKNKGWINWKHFFGTERISYNEAKKFVHKLKLRTPKDWKDYCNGEFKDLPKKYKSIPLNPITFYRNEWISWEDWLGNVKFLPFKEAREYVRKLKLKGQIEWKKYCKGELKGYEKKPDNIPASPSTNYKNEGWLSYGDWLGTGSKKRLTNDYYNENIWLSFENAKIFVHSLNLKNQTEWELYIKNKLNLPKKPNNIPNCPAHVYKKEWINWENWLKKTN